MANPIRIPKTMASLVDPHAPAFVTTFSAEVRNTIYKVFFKHDEPVLLHNTDEYHPGYPSQSKYNNHEYYTDDLKVTEDIFESGIGLDGEFKHGFQHGLPILLCCRQMYHEGASVLYGQNTFVISRALHRHDHSFEGLGEEADYDSNYNQLKYAPYWLSSIGSQIHLLRTISIDVDAVCPQDCSLRRDAFDMLPFVKLLRSYPALASKLRFHQTGRQLLSGTKSHRHHIVLDNGNTDHSVSTRLNNILTTLVDKDDLNIVQYYGSYRLFTAIVVGIHASRNGAGWIGYRGRLWNKHFVISNDGLNFTLPDNRSRRCNLLSMTQIFSGQFFSLASFSSLGTLIDLDSRRVQGIDLGLFQVNKNMRSRVAYHIATANVVTLKMISHVSTSSFDDFSALNDLHNSASALSILLRTYERSLGHVCIIHLNLDLTTSATLEDIRIDVCNLLSLFKKPESKTIRISLVCPRGTSTHREETELCMRKLQQEAYLLLSDLLFKWPTNTPNDVTRQLPAIWINGRGELVSTTYEQTATSPAVSLQNNFGNLTLKERAQKGSRFAAALEPIWPRLSH